MFGRGDVLLSLEQRGESEKKGNVQGQMMPVQKTPTLWKGFVDREGKEAAVLQKWGETVRTATQDPPAPRSAGDDQFKRRGRRVPFPTKQIVVSVVTSAVKSTLVDVKIIFVGSKTTIWSAAATATIYGRSI